MIVPEVLRVVRHGVTPLVIIAVERGWVPSKAQDDTIEVIAIVLSIGGVYFWSLLNERRRGDS